MTDWEAYGPPALQFEALRLWIHGRQFPDSMDSWDGNWLRVTAHCAEAGASVVVTGALLDTVSFMRFGRELRGLYERLEGVAVLESHEPELKVTVVGTGATGRMKVRVEIRPDRLTQTHSFEFVVDQSYVPAVLTQCEQVLTQYPVRNAAARGA